LNTVEDSVFVEDYIVTANPETILCFESVRLWIEETRNQLKEKLGKYYPPNDRNVTTQTEPKVKPLSAAQCLIIEYLKNGKKLDQGRLTQKSYIAKLARNYHGVSEDAFKEQLKRRGENAQRNINPYLTIKDLTEGQNQSAIENYEAVLEYLKTENNEELIKEVELILNRLH